MPDTANDVVISVQDLHKSFGDHEVLKGIDLDVREGEVVCVIGVSGSGKSTLLRCFNRLEQPTSGTIVVLGTDITRRGVKLAAVRRNVGMVFQQFNLFSHMSALENVMEGPLTVLGKSKKKPEKSPNVSWTRWGPRAGALASGPTVRRPAAACRHCPGVGPEPADHALR